MSDPTRYSGLIAAMDNAVAQGLTVHMATRATCAEHLEHGDDKATEPLTAAAFGPAVRLLRELVACLSTATPVRGDLAHALAEVRRFLEGAVASLAPLDASELAKLVGQALYGWGDDEPNEATGYLLRAEAEWIARCLLREGWQPPPRLGQPVAGERSDG